MPIPDVSGWLHDVRDVPADYRRAGLPGRRVDGVTPVEHAAPSPATAAIDEIVCAIAGVLSEYDTETLRSVGDEAERINPDSWMTKVVREFVSVWR